MDNKDITYFAETDFRNKRTPFGIKTSDRTRHMYIIGKTGMGKSTLLENLAVQDIKNGNGLSFIDPHGKSAELLLDYVPKERIKDVIYFAPHDVDYPVSFNVMEDVGKDQRHLVANGLMASFKKIWPDVWSARMEYISMNIILALLEYPGSTLLGINRMLSDKDYRKKVVANITDPSVKSFWVNEFAKYSDKIMVEAGASIQNKFGQFSSNPLIRNIIGQTKSSFDLRDLMDNKKIFIANLSKGRMGEINTNLIGGMLITKIYLAAMSRARVSDTELKKLPNFYTYVDEFQSFVNDSFADILSEARKYKLNLTIAHQYIEQMPETVRNAVFGNVGTTIAFRVGPFDAEVLEKIFAPKFTAEDIVNLGFAQIYLTLMIDGVGSQPFSAKTMPPIPLPVEKFTDEIIEESRRVYAKKRDVVEAEISKWHEAEPVTQERIETNGFVKGSSKFVSKEKDTEIGYPNKKPFYEKKSLYAPFKNTQDGRNISTPKGLNLGEEIKKTIKAAELEKESNKIPNQVVVKEEAPKKFSLESLKKEKVQDNKSTGKNIGELKSIISTALNSNSGGFVLGKTDKKKEEKPALQVKNITPSTKYEINDPEQQIIKNDKKETHVPKEVPEDILRNILKTDE